MTRFAHSLSLQSSFLDGVDLDESSYRGKELK
jgi:hypothetical protein